VIAEHPLTFFEFRTQCRTRLEVGGIQACVYSMVCNVNIADLRYGQKMLIWRNLALVEFRNTIFCLDATTIVIGRGFEPVV
jgi:hypothetical protein